MQKMTMMIARLLESNRDQYERVTVAICEIDGFHARGAGSNVRAIDPFGICCDDSVKPGTKCAIEHSPIHGWVIVGAECSC